ncbi:hypothetical protein ACHAXS_004077 [Conticribra weissflogii]
MPLEHEFSSLNVVSAALPLSSAEQCSPLIPRWIEISSTSSSSSSLDEHRNDASRSSLRRTSRPRGQDQLKNMSNASWDDWDGKTSHRPSIFSLGGSRQSFCGSEHGSSCMSSCLSKRTATSAVFVGRRILKQSSFATDC